MKLGTRHKKFVAQRPKQVNHVIFFRIYVNI